MPAATNPTFTLGSISFNTAMRAGKSFFKINNTEALFDAPPTRKSDTALQGMHGTDDSLTYYGARVLPVEGEVHAQSPSERVTMEQALRKQLALATDQDYATADGYQPLLFTDEDGVGKQLYVKVIDGPSFRRMGERREQMREFRFQLYAADPLIYSQSLYSSTHYETVVGTNFSVIQGTSPRVPFSLIANTAPSASATNAGSVASPPLLTVTGPTIDPVVTNATTGKKMAFSGLTLLAGETLAIDVAAATITKTSGWVSTDASGYLNTSVSRWIYVDPGTNDFTLIDSSPDAITATLTLQWRDAWL